MRLIPAKDIGVSSTDLNPMHELLTTETIWAIIDDTIDDATVNRLVWESLGIVTTKQLKNGRYKGRPQLARQVSRTP